MKSLKVAVVACSLFAAAAAAYAQTEAPTANAPQQVAQPGTSAADASARRDAAKPAKKVDDCVGPVSFCNIYFGS
ncbi:hypothetical protein [Paraburkholderia caballeronis]|uniref:PsiF repeat-containing protein n=1 Tax=Paraburkholderia caballeronis TaxID=416943 RepID=A0A1H7UKK1_9BURK|nr:hypothetical protein [Paraburkholderia caballeronis]PXW17466.1 hypothetical protein C7403_1184 [Paraburkholderia caballeronis]PXW95055.1 hypothetical protein C7407_1184 [Paraburkholderia caballeronis]RAJ90901.1 hypothetical protein C7409_1184 [Paraburkholderia caballeronis]TDV26789.1 hypothetical protein C7405_11998 [Paraburkholderia caballeronis]SEE16781.1 hypothetical protein SAMN05445871_4819 [Paraburkholderia caballeronis]